MTNKILTPYIQYVELDSSIGFRKIKKTVSVNGVWEEKIFIMLTDGSNRHNIQQWLKDHYGPGVYGETWWATFTSVCMLDKIYTHYILCQ
jgi:hypothetical protein